MAGRRAAFRWISLFALLHVCSAVAQQPARRDREDEPLALIAPIASSVIAALGSTALPQSNNNRMIRLWWGFGSGWPQRLLLIEEAAQGVYRGTACAFWPADYNARTLQDFVRKHYHVVDVRTSDQHQVAILVPSRGVDWASIWKSLERARVRELRCGSEMADELVDFGSGTLLVHVISEGTVRRQYRRISPMRQSLPKEQSAVEIVRLFEAVFAGHFRRD